MNPTPNRLPAIQLPDRPTTPISQIAPASSLLHLAADPAAMRMVPFEPDYGENVVYLGQFKDTKHRLVEVRAVCRKIKKSENEILVVFSVFCLFFSLAPKLTSPIHGKFVVHLYNLIRDAPGFPGDRSMVCVGVGGIDYTRKIQTFLSFCQATRAIVRNVLGHFRSIHLFNIS